MSYIKYSLTNAARLDTMAATGPGPAFAGHHPLPANPGFYLIRNSVTDNRYVGKAGNLQRRFNDRMGVVNELGLRTANLTGIDVFWGICEAWDTPTAGAIPIGAALAAPGPAIPRPPMPPGAPAAPAPIPAVAIGGMIEGVSALGPAPARPLMQRPNLACPVPDYSAQQVVTMIDGCVINVEALLIRWWMRCGVGGWITNLVYTQLFHNPTANPMHVMVEWAAGVTTGIPAAHKELTINAGSNM